MLREKKMTGLSKIMLLLSTLLWGSSFFILKNTLNEVPIYFLLCCRFLFSAILLSIIFWKKWKLINIKYLWSGSLTGAFLGLAYIFQTIGLMHTTPGINAFLTAFYCVLVPFICWAVMKKKPNKFNIISSVICIFGIGLVCLDSSISFSFFGEGFTLICSLFFGVQIVAMEIFGKDMDIILHTIIQFLAAFVVCLIFFLFTEEIPSSMSSQAVLSIIYVIIFPTAVSFVFMYIGIKHTSASYSSLVLCLEAVFGVLFSILFYHERITFQIGVGFVIIFMGMVLNETKLSFLKRNQNEAFKNNYL